MLARHLADYVLVWAQEDLGKSSHMARIANSVFKGHCYNSPCDQWFDHADGRTSDMKAASLVWHLCGKQGPAGPLDPTLFRRVFVSKHGGVMIYAVGQVSQFRCGFPQRRNPSRARLCNQDAREGWLSAASGDAGV